MSKITVMGGAGAMGKIIVRDLVEFAPKETEICVADFDLKRAAAVADQFSKKHKMSMRQVQVQDVASTAAELKGTTVVINSAPYQYNLEVMRAALLAGSHYIDLGGLFHMTNKQLGLHEEFSSQSLLALLGMGAAPGITNILSRYLCDQLDSVTEIHTLVAGKDLSKYSYVPALPISYSLQTILDEFSSKPAVFTKGKMTFVEPLSGMTPEKFPPPIGTQRPMYTLHSEVATLPDSFRAKGVKEVSFKIAFDEDFFTKVKFLRDMGFGSHEPINVNGSLVAPIQVANRVAMAQTPAKIKGNSSQAECVRAKVIGKSGKKKLTLIGDCITTGMKEWGVGTDINTGSPPAVAAIMILNGEIKGQGTLPSEMVVPPELFFKALEKRKMRFYFRKTAK